MRYFLLLLVLVVFGGCGDSSKLSRNKAESVIQSFVRFNRVTDVVPRKTVNWVWDGSEHPSMFGAEKLRALLSDLAQRGVVTFTRESGIIPEYQITLTAKGEQFSVSDSKSKGEWTVKLCDRKITEISGIQIQQESAKVTFKWSTANPTPFGETTPKLCSSTIRDASALLVLFDDGWRVKTD